MRCREMTLWAISEILHCEKTTSFFTSSNTEVGRAMLPHVEASQTSRDAGLRLWRSIEKPNLCCTDGPFARGVDGCFRLSARWRMAGGRAANLCYSRWKLQGTGVRRAIFDWFIQMADSQHDSIHAQTEIYPGRRLSTGSRNKSA